MPLSEYEQRVLEQMEQQLTSDDPKLANTFHGGSSSIRRWLLAGAGALVGLVILVIGAVTSQPLIGVAGFVAMFVAVVLAVSPPRRRRRIQVVGAAPRRRRRRSLTERFEERWDRRREQGSL